MPYFILSLSIPIAALGGYVGAQVYEMGQPVTGSLIMGVGLVLSSMCVFTYWKAM